MSEEKIITKDIAEEFLKDEYSVDLEEFTSIEDAAAESLSKHEGDYLDLSGLTELSDAAAESLSKQQGDLNLDGLTELSDAAAESFSKYKGDKLYLGIKTELSEAAVKSLAKMDPDRLGRGFIQYRDYDQSEDEDLGQQSGLLTPHTKLRKEPSLSEYRSLKFIEYHMFETFHPIFQSSLRLREFWGKDEEGRDIYTSIVRDWRNGGKKKIVFPPFDPDCDKYDNYKHSAEQEDEISEDVHEAQKQVDE